MRNRIIHGVLTLAVVLGYQISIFANESSATVWIDVRTPAEYASGHIGGAYNVEFQQIEEKIAEITSDKNADIRLYCRSGRRSGVAKQSLIKLGYRNVHNEGGYAAALVAHKGSANN